MNRIGAQTGWRGTREAWGSPLPCQELGGGILKAADPDARMEVEGGAEDL